MKNRANVTDTLAIAGLVALVAAAAYGYVTLPDQIVVKRAADATLEYGSKLTLWTLPAVGVFTFVLVNWRMSAPLSRYNLPIRTTPENSPQVLARMRDLLRLVRAELTVGFACIETQVVASAAGTLSPGFLPVVVLFAFGLIATILWNLNAVLKLR